MSRNVFLSIFILFCAGIYYALTKEVNRVQEVTDTYINHLIDSGWAAGCLHATDINPDKCQAIASSIDFEKLREAIKKTAKELEEGSNNE